MFCSIDYNSLELDHSWGIFGYLASGDGVFIESGLKVSIGFLRCLWDTSKSPGVSRVMNLY